MKTVTLYHFNLTTTYFWKKLWFQLFMSCRITWSMLQSHAFISTSRLYQICVAGYDCCLEISW